MSTAEAVDVTAEEVGTEIVPAAPTNIFRTDDPVEVVAQATRVADALKDVIVQRKLYENIQGKAHVKVEGWQLVGAMLGVTAIVTATDKLDDQTWKASVEARTTDGRVVGAADALCSKRETRGPWKNADDYAVLSMAQTRATAKALKGPLGFVVSLAGYATTPAEEMPFAEPEALPAIPEGERIDASTVNNLFNGIKLLGFDKNTGPLKMKLNTLRVPLAGGVKKTLATLTKAQGAELAGWLNEQLDKGEAA